MRLTAQRVVSREGKGGINAFCYLHGPPQTWLDEPSPEVIKNPGHLTNSHVEIPPLDNRVRSFLDLIAPDHVPSVRMPPSIQGMVRRRAMVWSLSA
jgi:hypothetical protein